MNDTKYKEVIIIIISYKEIIRKSEVESEIFHFRSFQCFSELSASIRIFRTRRELGADPASERCFAFYAWPDAVKMLRKTAGDAKPRNVFEHKSI